LATDADTTTSRKWARPVRASGGVYTWEATGVDAGGVERGWSRDNRPDHQGERRRRRRLPRADRTVPTRAAGALLPDARVTARRRGRPAGDAARGLAGPRRIRGSRRRAHLALSD